MKQYKLSLSTSSFDKMVKELNNYSVKLDKAKELILKALADYTKQKIQYYISQSTGLTGYTPTEELLNSITISDIFKDTIKIYTNLFYAKYVEYGTGIVGSRNPHPQLEGWKYDINSHGESGWKYQDSNGEWHWTKGEASHKFIYNAFQDLSKNYITIAKEVLRKEGLI